MVTKKKRHKIRDPDQMRRNLIIAIGEILEQKGHSGLRVNAIARHLGRDKNLIRYYFHSLNNLKKTYIKEKDYWPLFFEQYQLDKPADKDGIKRLFIKLLRENYLFFKKDKEMQKIILWQISEDNPLLRSISDAREEGGEKLLRLTDPFFKNTKINFRSIVALLLGGIYYIVLHSGTNGSKVSGLDINNELDSKSLYETIGQIILWAFKAAESGESQNS